jgi:hypothetical protein
MGIRGALTTLLLFCLDTTSSNNHSDEDNGIQLRQPFTPRDPTTRANQPITLSYLQRLEQRHRIPSWSFPINHICQLFFTFSEDTTNNTYSATSSFPEGTLPPSSRRLCTSCILEYIHDRLITMGISIPTGQPLTSIPSQIIQHIIPNVWCTRPVLQSHLLPFLIRNYQSCTECPYSTYHVISNIESICHVCKYEDRCDRAHVFQYIANLY